MNGVTIAWLVVGFGNGSAGMTTAFDERVREVFALPRGRRRGAAIKALAADFDITTRAVRYRWDRLRRPATTMPEAAVDLLPVAPRPAWMTPITRERLMAGR